MNTACIYEAPIIELDPVLSTLHILVHLILTIGIHPLHFTNEETEAQWD